MSTIERLRGMLAMAVASDDAFNRLSPAGFRLLRELLIALNPKGEAVSAVIDEGYLWGFEEGGRLERERADFLEAEFDRVCNVLRIARAALATSYNVTTYPGDGTGPQADAIRAIDRALSEGSGAGDAA